jgi:hypothetical protein
MYKQARLLLPLSLQGRGSKVRVLIQRALSRAIHDSASAFEGKEEKFGAPEK